MSVSINKKTVNRLHEFCQRGEKYDNLINRLLDIFEREKEEVRVSDVTVRRLVRNTGCKDVDEALNMVLDKCGKFLR